VHVTAHSTARDVTLLPDRLAADAVVDEALIDLPAGATATFTVRTAADLDPDDLTRSPVLRTANELRAVDVVAPPDRTTDPDVRQTAPVPISDDAEATA
jgi:beta-mannosidase